jgi:calcium-dependent protein kinase
MGCLCSDNFYSAPVLPKRTASAASSFDGEYRLMSSLKSFERNFFADYKLHKEIIGYGARGEICLCTENSSKKTFAVKILNKAQLPQEIVKARLVKKQVEMVSVLNHPSILKIYDFYEDRSNYYILMDYAKGGDLFNKLEKFGPLTEAQASRIMEQVFLGLAHMHRNGIAHRDIKPENILIEEKGSEINVKIIDFDTAASFESRKFYDKQGSRYYMAPEVIKGDYNEKCDLWSAGVMLYVLLTNSFPFHDEQDKETEHLILSGKIDLEYLRSEDISDEAIELLNTLLNTNPSKRIDAFKASNHEWILKFR